MVEITNNMLTGVKLIDDQHKELITRINGVLNMGAKAVSKEEISKTIDFLGEYIIKHFGDEEALQRKSNYPKYDVHKNQHQYYINEFKKMKAEFLANGVSAKFTVTLNTSIINWIVNHIKIVDVEFGRFYNSAAK